jgi:hypothetical protein
MNVRSQRVRGLPEVEGNLSPKEESKENMRSATSFVAEKLVAETKIEVNICVSCKDELGSKGVSELNYSK